MSTTMSLASTRETMEAYVASLLSFGDYASYLAQDVTITLMGNGQEIKGREAARAFIDFLHQQAFQTNVEVRNVLFGNNIALAEIDFVGTHIGEFEGIAASNKQVRVPYAVAYELEEDKIRALRIYFPMELLLQQLRNSGQ
jgi:predicted ester cyclase